MSLAIFSENKIVGFILTIDNPKYIIGAGINEAYANKGIMTKAWEEIKNHPDMHFPIYAHTSDLNENAIRFLKNLAFKK